jgi:hyperosmotically inducible periplasmic protein
VIRTSNATVQLTVLASILVMALGCNRSETPAETRETPAASTTPAAEQRTDAPIVTNVQAKYYQDDLVRGRDIAVYGDDGTVTLRGSVPSADAKQRAVELARSVDGVRDVKDELQVRATPQTVAATPGETDRDTAGTAGRVENTVEPAWITTRIQAQYFANPEVKPWNVDVTTASNGVVTLEGEVDAPEARTEAVRIARETQGVTRVDDHLRVKGEPSAAHDTLQRPDLWLTAKIQSKYFLDHDVKASNIDVDTQSAVVTLTGTVGSESEERAAVALARSTEGVKDVRSQLKIDPAAADRSLTTTPGARNLTKVPDLQRPDAWITMKIQSQYFLDPDVKGHEINVDTTRGVVALQGTVASAEQKQRAEAIARSTDGVTRVVNELTVQRR